MQNGSIGQEKLFFEGSENKKPFKTKETSG